jgi:hypothetical protein
MALFVNKTVMLSNDTEHSSNRFAYNVNNGKKISQFDSILDSFASNTKIARSLNTKQFDVTVSDTYIAKSELYSKLINGIVNRNNDTTKSGSTNETDSAQNENYFYSEGSAANAENCNNDDSHSKFAESNANS